MDMIKGQSFVVGMDSDLAQAESKPTLVFQKYEKEMHNKNEIIVFE